MSARVVLAMAAALGAGSAWADEKVQPATKVSGGSQSSKVSSSSSSSDSSSRATSSRSSSQRSEGSRGYRAPETDAQRRHPRPGTGTGRFDYDGRRHGGGRYAWGSP